MPRGADAENIPPFLPTRHVKTRPLCHYPRVSGLARQRRRPATRPANASALNISTNTYASDDIPLLFSGSFIVEGVSPKLSAPTMTGLATPPASQITIPTRLSMSPPPKEETRKQQAMSCTSTSPPATRNTSTMKLQPSTAPVKSRKRARSVTDSDEENTSPKTKTRKQAKANVVPPILAGTKRPRHPPSPGVPSFADDLAPVTVPNPKVRKQLRKLVESGTPVRSSASTNVPKTEFIERRKPTSVDIARRRRRTVSLRIHTLPPPDLRAFEPPPPPSPSEDPLLLKGSKRRHRIRRSDVGQPRLESRTRASKDEGRVSSSSSVHTPLAPEYHQDMGINFNDVIEWDNPPTKNYIVPLKFTPSSSSQHNSSTKPGPAARLASPYPLAKKAKNSPLPVRRPVAEENEFWGTTHDIGHGLPSDDSDNEVPVPVPSIPVFQTRTKPPTTTPNTPLAPPAVGERTPPVMNALPRVRAPTPRRKTLSERMTELGSKLGGEESSFRAPTRFTELDALPSDSVSPVKEDLTPPSDDTNEVAESTAQYRDNGLDLAAQDEHSVTVEMERLTEGEVPLFDSTKPDNGTATTGSVEQSFGQPVTDPSVDQNLDMSQDASFPLSEDELPTNNRLHSPMLKQSTPKAILSDFPTESSPALPRFEFQSPTSHMVMPSPFFHQTPVQKQFQQTYQHFDFDSQAPTSSLHMINIPAITAQSQYQDNFNNRAGKTMEAVGAFEDDDESSWEGEDEDGEPHVRVSSKNPVAAARAAAILKLHHDYIEGSQRKRQRTSSFGSVRKHTPSIRGSPALLRRIETELATPLKGASVNHSFGSIGNTSIRAVPTTVDFALLRGNETFNELSRDEGEEHAEETTSEEDDRRLSPPSPAPWTKNEWRLLEQCFTDVRDDLACALDVVEVDVDEIDLDEVIQRFVDADEGKHELVGDWAWKKIRRRAFALKDRQRSGVARVLGSEIASPARTLYTPLRTPSVEPRANVRGLLAPTPLRSNNAPATPKHNLATLGPIPIIREIAATPTPASTRRVMTDMPPPPFIPVKVTMPPPVSPSPFLVAAPKVALTSAPATALGPAKPYMIPPSTPLGPTVRDQPSSTSKRVLDWMGSFLTRTPQSSTKKSIPNPIKSYPVLPPVSDGDRDALKHIEPVPPRSPEKVVHPKDQVQLQHVPTPDSVRPPPKIKLNHKGSSGSVRDLVKSFEGLQDERWREEARKRKLATKGGVAKLKRMDSGGSLRSNVSGYASSTADDTTKDGRNISFNSNYESSRSFDNSASWIRR